MVSPSVVRIRLGGAAGEGGAEHLALRVVGVLRLLAARVGKGGHIASRVMAVGLGVPVGIGGGGQFPGDGVGMKRGVAIGVGQCRELVLGTAVDKAGGSAQEAGGRNDLAEAVVSHRGGGAVGIGDAHQVEAAIV